MAKRGVMIEKVGFLRHYLGVRKLKPQHKRFARAILARVRAETGL